MLANLQRDNDEMVISIKNKAQKSIEAYLNVPNAIIVALSSSLVSILRINHPMQMPNMYGDSLDQG